MKNNVWRVISERKKKLLMKTFMIALKANLIKVSDNKKKKKKKKKLRQFICSKFNDSLLA